MKRGQSAVEFLTVYGYVLLILALVISVLIIYISLPKSILPLQCVAYNSFSCVDAVYGIDNLNGASSLLVFTGKMTVPGVVNITGFSSTMSSNPSIYGYCEPSLVTEGENFYCVAGYTFTPKITSNYYATFKIVGNYCTPVANNPFFLDCPGSSNYSWTGNMRITATNVSIKATAYVPLTITNTQDEATPVNFQENVSFPASKYAAYEDPNLGNIRFYYKGIELYSWCQTNCNSSASGNATFWVKLPVAIPKSSSITIGMYFMPQVVGYTGYHAGEAANYSIEYGLYDNGASVFNFYSDFNGTHINASKWLVYNGEYSSASADYGVTFYNLNNTNTAFCSSTVIRSTYDFGPNSTLETYVSSTLFNIGSDSLALLDAGTENGYSLKLTGNGASGTMNLVYTDYHKPLYQSAGTLQSIGSGPVVGVWGISWPKTGEIETYWPGGTLSSADTTYSPSKLTPALGIMYCGNDAMSSNWVLVRDYPPNGIMPGVTFGTVTTF